MDESISTVKSVKPFQSRGAKALSSQKSNKEASVQRDGVKSTLRSKENLTAARDERTAGGPVSRMVPDDKKRGRPNRVTRLTGRTGSGERGKAKGANPPQPGSSESRTPVPADGCGSAAKRDTVSPVKPATPERRLAEQDKTSTGASMKDKSHVLKAAAPMHQHSREGAEDRPPTEEGRLTEQQLGLRQVEERLYRDHIQRLIKKSPEFPNYQYFCKLCSVHIDNIQGGYKHIKEKRHKKNLMEKQEENELLAIPPPSAAQLRALDAVVMETASRHGISEEDFGVRKAVVSRMDEIIKRHLSACSLRLYGSCLTRFAFKTSDINIDVIFPSTMTQPEVLIQVLEILKNRSEFSEVESDFHAKVPAVFCRDRSSGLMCKVSAGNNVACLTTSHLAALAKLEPRLVPLVLAFRCWARLCHIDCQAEGGIPSYSFALMVIFFLQQRKEPVLPVYLGHWMEGFDVKRVDEYHLTGIVQEAFVKWERRRPNTAEGRGENHGEARGNGTKPEPSKSDAFHPSEGQSRLALKQRKEASLGQLWLELFRFYTLEFALEENIISIRLKQLLSREVKNWPRRRLAIEDPFAFKRNVARSLNSQMVFEYIQECFRAAYKYFAVPQRRSAGGTTRRGEDGETTGRQGTQEDEESDSDEEDGLDLMVDGNKASSSDLLDREEEEEEDAGSSQHFTHFDEDSPQCYQDWMPRSTEVTSAPSLPTLKPPDNPLSHVYLQPIHLPSPRLNPALSPITKPCGEFPNPTTVVRSPTKLAPSSTMVPPKLIPGESEEDFLRRKREYWRIKKKEQRARKAIQDKGVNPMTVSNNWRPVLPVQDLETQETAAQASGLCMNPSEDSELLMSMPMDPTSGPFPQSGYSAPMEGEAELLLTDFLGTNDEEGPVSEAAWRSRFLMDYNPLNQLLVCMVCGELQYSHSMDGVRAHIDEVHPHTLTLEPRERQRILEAWDEQVSKRERFFISQLQQQGGVLAETYMN
ncbi:terminal uridylyltransferase 4 [Austrofundulus limnaeus]|uniref:polynucleotide adenylyltransferase n=1 Tax=Austrofundulus limnaeus TaxID=52670 RepID=A0A2I4D6A2_AUSLI|nr:PREDICTED: terminal uridylyltransferase 4-like [Austrofundulus limnaeus]